MESKFDAEAESEEESDPETIHECNEEALSKREERKRKMSENAKESKKSDDQEAPLLLLCVLLALSCVFCILSTAFSQEEPAPKRKKAGLYPFSSSLTSCPTWAHVLC